MLLLASIEPQAKFESLSVLNTLGNRDHPRSLALVGVCLGFGVWGLGLGFGGLGFGVWGLGFGV